MLPNVLLAVALVAAAAAPGAVFGAAASTTPVDCSALGEGFVSAASKPIITLRAGLNATCATECPPKPQLSSIDGKEPPSAANTVTQAVCVWQGDELPVYACTFLDNNNVSQPVAYYEATYEKRGSQLLCMYTGSLSASYSFDVAGRKKTLITVLIGVGAVLLVGLAIVGAFCFCCGRRR